MANTLPTANASLLIIQCFPMKHFGKLFGLLMCVSTIIILLQYPMYFVAIHYFEGKFLVMNVILLCLVIATLVHPFNLYRKSLNA